MSVHETPITRRYWRRHWKPVGGCLIEEYLIVQRRWDASPRWVDGLIVLPEKPKRARAGTSSSELEGRDVIAVQTKAKRLDMPLIGQAYCSLRILKRHHKVRKVRSIALCTPDDAILHPIAKSLGIEVVVDKPPRGKSKKRAS